MLILFFASDIIDIYGLAAGQRVARIVALVLRYVFLLIPYIAFTKGVVEMRQRYSHIKICGPLKPWRDEISNEDYFGLFTFTVSFFSITGQGLLPLSGQGGLFFIEDFNSLYLIFYNTLISVYGMIIGIIPNRITMHNSYKLQHELDHRRVFVK